MKKLTEIQVNSLRLASDGEWHDFYAFMRVGAQGQTTHSLVKHGLLEVEQGSRLGLQKWRITEFGKAALATGKRP